MHVITPEEKDAAAICCANIRCHEEYPGTQVSAQAAGQGAGYMFSMTAVANSEHLRSVAPSMRR